MVPRTPSVCIALLWHLILIAGVVRSFRTFLSFADPVCRSEDTRIDLQLHMLDLALRSMTEST